MHLISETTVQKITALLWLAGLLFMYLAYQRRNAWSVGTTPWLYLPLSFAMFALRELVSIPGEPLLIAMKYVLGMWSAFFMLLVSSHVFWRLYLRKKQVTYEKYLPMLLNALPLLVVVFLLLAGTGVSESTAVLSTLEAMVWILCSAAIVVQTYLIGTVSTGGFVRFYMLLQFAAYSALMWKLWWLIGGAVEQSYLLLKIGFGAFSVMTVYTLNNILKKLSNNN